MKKSNIKDFKNGWFIGDFEPSTHRTKDFEIAHHFYKKCHGYDIHYHAVATEMNYIVTGKISINGELFGNGDGFIFDPRETNGEITFLEDTDLIIVKFPSVPGDKYKTV